jgi:SAM-dependent methyltransferase
MARDWQVRQDEMEHWYEDFAAEPAAAAASLEGEYRPFADVLAGLRGRVLDVGGGAGLAAMYLRPEVVYTVIDPGRVWAEPVWREIRRSLAGRGPEPDFVTGTAEQLPFADASFDAALAFWSLNHVADAERALAEIHRVLRAGGKALLVLEDMEPTWRDVARLAVQRLRGTLGLPTGASVAWYQESIGGVQATTLHKLAGRPWPLQPDHLQITDADLAQWLLGRFRTEQRSWRGGYLTFELEKLPSH